MNTRLYRLTPAGGKPNHYTDSYASALVKLHEPRDRRLFEHLLVGERLSVASCSVVEGCEIWHGQGTWERVA